MNNLATSHANPYDIEEMANRLEALSRGDRRTAYGLGFYAPQTFRATSKPVVPRQGILKPAQTKTKTVVRRRHK